MSDAPLYRFELPGLPPTANEILAMDRRKHMRIKKQWRNDIVFCALAICRRPLIPLTRARLRFTRHSTTEPDYENLTMSFKAICDGLVEAKVIVDDSPKHVEREYEWAKAKRGEGRVVVEVWPLR